MHHRGVVVVMVMMNVVVPVVTLDDHGVGVGESGKAEDGKTKNEKGFHR